MNLDTIKTVLVVDDDVAILEVMKIVLEEEGIAVLTDTGDQAVPLAEQHRPDLLLLDIWMRGLDGREISRLLKSHPQLNDIPIVLMSAHNHEQSVVEEAQADDFIEKPFDIDAMLEMVKKYV